MIWETFYPALHRIGCVFARVVKGSSQSFNLGPALAEKVATVPATPWKLFSTRPRESGQKRAALRGPRRPLYRGHAMYCTLRELLLATLEIHSGVCQTGHTFWKGWLEDIGPSYPKRGRFLVRPCSGGSCTDACGVLGWSLGLLNL